MSWFGNSRRWSFYYVCQENHRSEGEHVRLAMFVDRKFPTAHENLSLQYLRFSCCTCPFSGVQCTSEDVIGVYIVYILKWMHESKMTQRYSNVKSKRLNWNWGCSQNPQSWKPISGLEVLHGLFFAASRCCGLAPSRHPKMVIFTWDMAWLSHHSSRIRIMTLPPDGGKNDQGISVSNSPKKIKKIGKQLTKNEFITTSLGSA